MNKLRTIKGTHDLLNEDSEIMDKIIQISQEVCKIFNFKKISTPIIEFSEVFEKTLGKSTDVVRKEMYTFVDQSGESITLRPEGTAPSARAILSNSLYENISQKFFYYGPMFRREKPQAGRLRQFHQFGLELFNQSSFFSDIEVILIAERILESLKVRKMLKLEINTLGTNESRYKYKETLKNFFLKYKSDLSEESQIRLDINPLRILDSKNSLDKKIVKDAPKIFSSLDKDSIFFYENFKKGLDHLNIEYIENPKLVRGLDYYTHVAFEFTSSHKGAQNAVLAGGRYDGLVNLLGGKNICGVGWAAGIERLSNLINRNIFLEKKKIISIFATVEELNFEVLKVLGCLESLKNISLHFLKDGSLKKKLLKANKLNSLACIIFGEDEFDQGKFIWKDFLSGKQELIDINSFQDFLLKKTL